MTAKLDGAAILQRRREETAAYALTAQQGPSTNQPWPAPGSSAAKVREFLPAAEIYARRASERKA